MKVLGLLSALLCPFHIIVKSSRIAPYRIKLQVQEEVVKGPMEQKMLWGNIRKFPKPVGEQCT
jgi:hypothetical protein